MSEVYHRFIHWSATFTDVVIQYMYCPTGFKDLELIALSILIPIFLLPHHNFCIGSSFNAKDNKVQTFPRWHTMLWVTYQLKLLNPLLTDHSVVRVTRLEEWVQRFMHGARLLDWGIIHVCFCHFMYPVWGSFWIFSSIVMYICIFYSHMYLAPRQINTSQWHTFVHESPVHSCSRAMAPGAVTSV